MPNTIYCSCIICKKEFSIKGIHSHYIAAHTVDGNNRVKQAGLRGNIKGGQSYANRMAIIRVENINEYLLNPKLCKHCHFIIPYEKRNNNFCNKSCSASFNNTTKDYTKVKETWKQKKLNSPQKKKKLTMVLPKKKYKTDTSTKTPPNIIEGDYTKLFRCECKHCKVIKLYRAAQKYCNNCQHLYSHDGRAKYWFTFNVFHYPELFDLSLITTYGFRDNKTNPNGITRDHKISVNDAIRNNYDPYYIKHPMNCQLMFFDENNRKKTKSSISYNDLIKLVDDYDNNVSR